MNDFKNIDSLKLSKGYGVVPFDTAEMATPAPFRVMIPAASAALEVQKLKTYFITGVVMAGVSKNEESIQILAATKDFNIRDFSSISVDKFDALKEDYDLVAFGEVM